MNWKAPTFRILHRVSPKLAGRFWRWAVRRYYPPERYLTELICPPHLWKDDPQFDWRIGD